MDVKSFVRLASGSYIGYNAVVKVEFLRKARQMAKLIAKQLGLAEGTYEIRTNKGGIAVSGEVTLHADHLYIHLGQTWGGMEQRFYYRACRNQKDYTGGTNRWMLWSDLLDPNVYVPAFASAMKNWEMDRYFGSTGI